MSRAIDFFSENYANREPVILEDGTSIQYPAGWTDEPISGAEGWNCKDPAIIGLRLRTWSAS